MTFAACRQSVVAQRQVREDAVAPNGTSTSDATLRPAPQGTTAGELAVDQSPTELERAAHAGTARLPVDRGVFDDLIPPAPELPPWLDAGPIDTWQSSDGATVYQVQAGVPLAIVQNVRRLSLGSSKLLGDDDEDGIPDALDILLGAKKAVMNGATYRSSYHKLEYPGGDVPRDEGVCSDVVVRALRNAGYDLQQLVQDDIKQSPKSYPTVEKPDSNIDHRRVRVLLPWFERHWRALPLDADATASVHLPGDVVFFDTLRGPEPDHLGIVSDQIGKSGKPLVINNWDVGHQTAPMDLLSHVPVTHRFRIPTAELRPAPSHRGLGGILRRAGIQVPAQTRQAVLVTTPTWTHSAALVRRFQRTGADAEWQAVGQPAFARIGTNGWGRGRGLHAEVAFAGLSSKREGDRKAPAGVFTLGTAFGPTASPPEGVTWPWRQARAGHVFVDDPSSPVYNQWQQARPDAPWKSAEDLTMYKLGVVVNHNALPARAGAGSAIFLHTSDQSRSTLGCTGLYEADLLMTLRWLSPDAHPVLIQLAAHVYD